MAFMQIKLLNNMFKITSILFKKNNNFNKSNHYRWNNNTLNFEPIWKINVIPLFLLVGIDDQKNRILSNTTKFAKGFRMNNALLWGVRGNGKSTLVKSIFNEVSNNYKNIRLLELNKNDLEKIIDVFELLSKNPKFRFIIFIDDLSFEKSDIEYKNIKSILDGNISNQPNNVILYVTSNRRHLMPEDMIDNEKSSAIHTHENIEEKISLSDRFGLWVGFHNLSQNDYLEIIKKYCKYFNIECTSEDLENSIKWSLERGNRTGRSAWQYIIELASKKQIYINL